MAATVKAYCATGASPTRTSADSGDAGSITMGKDDLVTSTAPTSIPTATGTNFSYRKTLMLRVTAGGGSTSLSNRGIKMSTSIATGLKWWQMPITSYTQNTGSTGTTAGDYPAASGSSGATPANPADGSYTLLTTSNVAYDAASVAATNATDNGKYLVVVLGVDDSFAGGGGTATLPNLIFQYDES